MKRATNCIAAVVSVLLLGPEDVLARGGRGGGGARPSVSRSPSVNRSPSMSRGPSVSRPSVSPPSARPRAPSRGATRPSTPSRGATRPSTPSRPSTQPIARPGTGAIQRPGARPGVGQPATRPGIGQPATRPGTLPATPGRQPSRGDLQQFLNLPKPGGPSQLPAPGRRPGAGIPERPGVGVRPGPGPGQRPGNLGRPIDVNRVQINQQVNNRYRNVQNRPFTPGWWGRHPSTLPARRYHAWHHHVYRPGHWWHWATAAALTRWVVFGWTQPVYYSYGSGGNVYYENNVVYVDGQEYCSSEEYYQQAVDIAGSVPQISDAEADQVEWMPLGVFALTQEGAGDSNLLLQLAVSKDGIIAGTLFNETTGSSRPVEGMVDRETQRAAWSLVDGKNADVVMETGLYNLTENEATALVHFGNERTQTWLMVRLDEPEAEAAGEQE